MSALSRTIAAMESAPPDELVRRLARALEDTLDVERAEVYLPDYHLSTLHPVGDADNAIPIDGSWEGRVFASQRPDVRAAANQMGRVGRVRVGLPITVRGDRRGELAGLVRPQRPVSCARLPASGEVN